MQTSRSELLSALEKLTTVSVVVVGDVILDRYIWSKVDRISPEAPVPVCLVQKMEDRLGGAANVCRNLRGLGVSTSLCGIIGDDPEGKLVLELLERESIGRDGILVDRTRPTSIKTRVIAQSQQLLRFDRERTSPMTNVLAEGFSAVVEAQIQEGGAVVLSDYGKGAFSEVLASRLEKALQEGRLSRKRCPLVIDPHPRNYHLYRGCTAAKPNRKEAESASGITIDSPARALEAGKKLLDLWQAEMIVLTLGEDGLMIVERDQPAPIVRPTLARRVFDVSGAGDTVTAIFTAALAAGISPAIAGDLANIGAGIVVSEIGTAQVTHDKLLAEIESLKG